MRCDCWMGCSWRRLSASSTSAPVLAPCYRTSPAARRAHRSSASISPRGCSPSRRKSVPVAAMDAARLGFRPASFDAVVKAFVLFLLPDPASALAEVRRVLRPDGLLGWRRGRANRLFSPMRSGKRSLGRSVSRPSAGRRGPHPKRSCSGFLRARGSPERAPGAARFCSIPPLTPSWSCAPV